MRRYGVAVFAAVSGLAVAVMLGACSSTGGFEYFTAKAEAKAFITAGKLPEKLPDNARDIRVLWSKNVHIATWHGDLIADDSCKPSDAQPPRGNKLVLESQQFFDVQQCSFGFQARDSSSIFWWPAE